MKPTSNTAVSVQLKNMLACLKQDPRNEPLIFSTVDLSIAENQFDLADRLLEDAEMVWPTGAGVLNRKAIIALRRDDPQAAITLLEEVMANGDTDAPIRYNLAYANYLIGNYADARKAIEPVLTEQERIPAMAPLYVLCLQQLGEPDAAIAYAEECLQQAPDDAELQGVLALLYFDNEKDIDACRRYTEMALRKNPDHPMALVTASALSMMDEQPDLALELAQKVVKRNPTDGRAWSSVGMACMYLLDLPSAQGALENAVRYMPGHIGTWHSLAWAQLLQNDINGAEASFNRALDIDRSFGETQGGLAVIAQLRGDKARAKTLMDRARRLAPAGLTLQYLRLLQLQESGDQQSIQQYLQSTLKRRPSFKGDSVLDMMQRMGRAKS